MSACLLGIACRYDGQSKHCPEITQIPGIIPIPVCPEQMGGLPTPRNPAFFVGGDGAAIVSGHAQVVDCEGRDVTECFLKGAQATLKVAELLGITRAILKERSPSCGTRLVTVEGTLVDGMGVTSYLLREQGMSLMNENGEVL
ncbi:MAG: DUF523 domain-containing protein [Desulfomonilia bacterium]|nr:DUF523 domain-containing protein [Desulfomonilia bacterium]